MKKCLNFMKRYYMESKLFKHYHKKDNYNNKFSWNFDWIKKVLGSTLCLWKKHFYCLVKNKIWRNNFRERIRDHSYTLIIEQLNYKYVSYFYFSLNKVCKFFMIMMFCEGWN